MNNLSITNEIHRIRSLEKLVSSAHKDLLELESEVKILELHPLNAYIVYSKKSEIKSKKDILSNYQNIIRKEKLNQLGI